MIDRSYVDDAYTISCDVSGCNASAEYDTSGDWSAMIAQAKADGWLFQQTDGEWSHSCGGHQ